MAHIRVIDEDEAEGKLFEIYDEVQKSRGRVSNILRIESLNPKGLKAHLELYMTLVFGKGPLDRLHRELLAVVTSAANGCDYCVIHHGEALLKYTDDGDWVEQLKADHTKAELDDKQQALADYAVGLTKSPTAGRKEAVEALRKAGFDDEAILHATEIVAYFNFVNRLAHGLGVDLEDDTDRDYDY